MKIVPKYFGDIFCGAKNFMLCKDEDYAPGDIIVLQEWNGTKYTGRVCYREVCFVQKDWMEYGLTEGYCILGFKTGDKNNG